MVQLGFSNECSSQQCFAEEGLCFADLFEREVPAWFLSQPTEIHVPHQQISVIDGCHDLTSVGDRYKRDT